MIQFNLPIGQIKRLTADNNVIEELQQWSIVTYLKCGLLISGMFQAISSDHTWIHGIKITASETAEDGDLLQCFCQYSSLQEMLQSKIGLMPGAY